MSLVETKPVCKYRRCTNPVFGRKLVCELHLTVWPYTAYLQGYPITDRRPHLKQIDACVDGCWVPEHRLMVSKYLGRLLERTEIVIHLDRDQTHNVLENLAIGTYRDQWLWHFRPEETNLVPVTQSHPKG